MSTAGLAMNEYVKAYVRWKNNGKKGDAPNPGDFGVSSYEAQKLRNGYTPAELIEYIASYSQVKHNRGYETDPRKKKKRNVK